MLSDLIASGAMHSLKSMFMAKKEKNTIIDPFSCLIKLALLKFMDKGTKISVHDNRIYFNSPNYIQGVVRFIYGDGREDLHNIYQPIQKCVEWFWNDKNDDMVYIFNNAVNGLKILKSSYSTYATIQHTLDYYIIVLMQKNIDFISKIGVALLDINKLTDIETESSKKSIKEDDTTTISSNDNFHKDIHKFLFELWTEREIKIVINLFKELETKQTSPEKTYIYDNLMKYCEMKENKLFNYIKENSSVL